jgi:hypothetical protein
MEALETIFRDTDYFMRTLPSRISWRGEGNRRVLRPWVQRVALVVADNNVSRISTHFTGLYRWGSAINTKGIWNVSVEEITGMENGEPLLTEAGTFHLRWDGGEVQMTCSAYREVLRTPSQIYGTDIDAFAAAYDLGSQALKGRLCEVVRVTNPKI